MEGDKEGQRGMKMKNIEKKGAKLKMQKNKRQQIWWKGRDRNNKIIEEKGSDREIWRERVSVKEKEKQSLT